MTDTTPTVPEWAVKRVCELTNRDGSTYSPENIEREGVLCASIGIAFARYIAEHEEPPVDPLLIEAREIAAKLTKERGFKRSNGKHYTLALESALTALRRGIELSREQSK